MVATGDTVVFRRHVCKVVGVREKYYQDKDYLELHALFEKSLKLYVAIDEAQPPLLRAPMDADAARAFLEVIPTLGPIDEDKMRAQASAPTLLERRIKEEYERLMKSLVFEDLVPVIRTALLRAARREKAGRPVASSDKKYYDLAEQFLVDELTVALSQPREDVRMLLKERLEQPQV